MKRILNETGKTCLIGATEAEPQVNVRCCKIYKKLCYNAYL